MCEDCKNEWNFLSTGEFTYERASSVIAMQLSTLRESNNFEKCCLKVYLL